MSTAVAVPQASKQNLAELLYAVTAMKQKLASTRAQLAESLAELHEMKETKEAEESSAEFSGPISPKAMCSCCGKVRDEDGPFDGNRIFYYRPHNDRPYALLCPTCRTEVLGKVVREEGEDKKEFSFGVRRGFRKSAKERSVEDNPDQWAFFRVLRDKVNPQDAVLLRAAQLTNADAERIRRLNESRAQQELQKAKLDRRQAAFMAGLKWMLSNKSFDVIEAARQNTGEERGDRSWVAKELSKELSKAGIVHTRPPKQFANREPLRRRRPQRTYKNGIAAGTALPGANYVEYEVNEVWDTHGRVTGGVMTEDQAKATKSVKYVILRKPRVRAPRVEETWMWHADSVPAPVSKNVVRRAIDIELGADTDVASRRLLPNYVLKLLNDVKTSLFDEGCKLYAFCKGTDTYTLYSVDDGERDMYIVALGTNIVLWAETVGEVIRVHKDKIVEIKTADLPAMYGEADAQDLPAYIAAVMSV